MAAWSRNRVITLVGATIVAALLLAGWWWQSHAPAKPVSELLREARVALATGDYETADACCREVLSRDPKNIETLLLAGAVAMKSERFEDALAFFRVVPPSSAEHSITAVFSAAEVSRGMGHLADAERDYRKVLIQRPQHIAARERLAFILDLQGRRWESVPHLLELLRQDQISFSTLIRLGARDAAIPAPAELEKARLAKTDIAAVKLAEAAAALAKHQPEKADSLLAEVFRQKPSLVEAHARLGLMLADRDPSAIPRWQHNLPAGAESHPDVWVARGLWAQQTGQTREAMRCFAEAAVLDPNQRIAQYQLSQLLVGSEFEDLAADCAERARLLQKLAALMSQLTLNRSDTEAMRSASITLERMGRYWEAYGWCGLILVVDPNQEAMRTRMQALHRRLTPELPLTAPAADPTERFDVSVFPLPVWPAVASEPLVSRLAVDVGPNIRFVDRAADAGLNFTYFNGGDPATPGTRMYEFSGGGIGVIDYDGDGFPDVYLTQGCRWPPKVESTEYRDRLFRNLGNGHFQDVTDAAGLGDGWFSQGVSIGDVDDDGWPDIYLANIGRNRMYRNNGDGTFIDFTDQGGFEGREWTTSCLLADIDGDGFPDIYDVNYLKGDDLFDRLCLVDGQQRTCVPSVFSAERDRIQLNQQDGRFHDVSSAQADSLEPARAGMGIIAVDVDGDGRLSLFVANDVVANSLLVNETVADGGPLVLRENALLAGLAFDRNGRAQACMGVAAGDVDGDGRIDLLVTNYYEEANSLYLQTAAGLFAESSRSAGLHDPSFRQLGFGAQFLDADLDGWLDLVIANGHLDDFRYIDIPYRMRPQFFSNRGSGRFENVTGQSVGDYFDRKLLGRSLTVLDWNRDGRPDFAVSHLETPVALVTNETDVTNETGRWLTLRLHGTQSSRDAIGTTVTLRCAEQSWTHQLTAGSGYQSSNERVLLFGLGDCERIDHLKIRWPSGLVETFDEIKANRELVSVEGAGKLLELPNGK